MELASVLIAAGGLVVSVWAVVVAGRAGKRADAARSSAAASRVVASRALEAIATSQRTLADAAVRQGEPDPVDWVAERYPKSIKLRNRGGRSAEKVDSLVWDHENCVIEALVEGPIDVPRGGAYELMYFVGGSGGTKGVVVLEWEEAGLGRQTREIRVL